MNNPPKIIFKYPSRSRPERFFNCLDSLVANINDPYNYLISCTLDEDDMTMNKQEVVDRIMEYKNIEIRWGLSDSKIHAVNRHIPEEYDFDIIIVHSDDMVFTQYGFDTMIRVDMITHFPEMDGLLHYPDQDAGSALATMYIAGRKWWEYRHKKIYHPSYKSLFCDNEEMEVAIRMGKYKYCGYPINFHLNPAYENNKMPRDEMFNRQQDDWNEDEKNFFERKGQNFFL